MRGREVAPAARLAGDERVAPVGLQVLVDTVDAFDHDLVFRGQHAEDTPSVRSLHGRTRPVGGQVQQRRRSGQVPCPVRELLLQRLGKTKTNKEFLASIAKAMEADSKN